eukprot:298082-Alexandrium_andersonii.AAC.1
MDPTSSRSAKRCGAKGRCACRGQGGNPKPQGGGKQEAPSALEAPIASALEAPIASTLEAPTTPP